MEQYKKLAMIYDFLTTGVDFEGWIDYLEEILQKFNFCPRSVLDLACGTGSTLLPLAKRGFVVTGIDLSEDMLAIARQRAVEMNLEVNFYQADMRNFTVPEAVDLVTCFHDGLNYLLTWQDLVSTFVCIQKALLPGGLFIFDLNNVFWLDDKTGSVTFLDEENLSLVWESRYIKDSNLWEINLTGFVRSENNCYEKFHETHRERGYTLTEVNDALDAAGLQPLASFDAFSFAPPRPHGIRTFYISRKF